ncbi:hypothetical protein ABCJ02_002478 [Salmonella enterica]
MERFRITTAAAALACSMVPPVQAAILVTSYCSTYEWPNYNETAVYAEITANRNGDTILLTLEPRPQLEKGSVTRTNHTINNLANWAATGYPTWTTLPGSASGYTHYNGAGACLADAEETLEQASVTLVQGAPTSPGTHTVKASLTYQPGSATGIAIVGDNATPELKYQ